MRALPRQPFGGIINSPALWTPNSVSNLSDYIAAWWTADDHGTANMTDDGSGLISAWVDRIGGLSATAATTARPTWSATAFNAIRPGLTFDGVANCLTSILITGLPNGATAGEVWGVSKPATSATTAVLLTYGGSTAATNRAIRKNNTDSMQVTDQSSIGTGTSGGFVAGQGHVGFGTFSGTVMNGYLDGTPFAANPTTIASLNTGIVRLRIGAGNAVGAATFFVGAISEVLIPKVITANVVLPGRSATLQQDLEGWAAWKYGFQIQLPSTHPYRMKPPMP